MKHHIGAYLGRYAEPEVDLADRVRATYRDVLVLPMFDEEAHRLERVMPATVDGLLLICVINAPEKARGTAAQHRCVATLRELGCVRGRSSLVPLRSGVDMLLIDRASEHLVPTRQGVGLARKIGADVALALIDAGRIENPRVHSTDADVELPDDYFASNRDPEIIAWSFPFRHHASDPAMHRSGQLYEAHLRFYRDGLEHAGSRYAFHSLGSTLCVDATGYAKVRGFPRRAAGEDFYLLNKLAKLGSVSTPRMTPIRIEARPSSRTPFGTGKSLARIPADPERYVSFNPVAFIRLTEALGQLRAGQLAQNGAVAATLREMGAATVIARVHRQYRSTDQRARAIAEWFDGLRTLQFLRRMRAADCPDQPLLGTLRRTRGLIGDDLDGLNDAWCRREMGTRSP